MWPVCVCVPANECKCNETNKKLSLRRKMCRCVCVCGRVFLLHHLRRCRRRRISWFRMTCPSDSERVAEFLPGLLEMICTQFGIRSFVSRAHSSSRFFFSLLLDFSDRWCNERTCTLFTIFYFYYSEWSDIIFCNFALRLMLLPPMQLLPSFNITWEYFSSCTLGAYTQAHLTRTWMYLLLAARGSFIPMHRFKYEAFKIKKICRKKIMHTEWDVQK